MTPLTRDTLDAIADTDDTDTRPPWLQLLNSGIKGRPTPWKEIDVPPLPPEGICDACVKAWVAALVISREAQRPQFRAVTCCHYRTGELYRVAFARAGQPSGWTHYYDVSPADMRELYFYLCMFNGSGFVCRRVSR